jgi:hypothetical protein
VRDRTKERAIRRARAVDAAAIRRAFNAAIGIWRSRTECGYSLGANPVALDACPLDLFRSDCSALAACPLRIWQSGS